MKINESISPSLFKKMAIVIGLFIVYAVWQGVNTKIAELRYQPVYGESFTSAERIETIDLQSLPIVVAQSVVKGVDSGAIDDQAIEDAFKLPEFSDEDIEIELESKGPEITAATKMFLTYRPAVSAISKRGAVINGIFWNVGEKINSMPVALDTGEIALPILASISRNKAVLSVNGEKLTLPFERF